MRLLYLCLLLLCSSLTQAFNDDTAPASQWIERMSNSLLELNYQGDFQYQVDDSKIHSCFRVWHKVSNGELYEQIDIIDRPSLGNAALGVQSSCRQASQPLSHAHVAVHHADILQVFDHHQHQHLNQYYDIHIVGHNRIAKHDVIEIAVKPKDRYRYGYLLSLDKLTGFPVRNVTLDRAGGHIERVEFFVLDIGADIATDTFQLTNDDTPVAFDNVSTINTPVQAWRAQWVPLGFSEATYSHSNTNDTKMFSDGLAVFSIFVDPLADSEKAFDEAHTQQGATTTYSSVAYVNNQAYRVTVMGNIPVNTAKHVAQSIEWEHL